MGATDGGIAKIAHDALLEYAAGQPRDKKGRFGGTGSGGGGGSGAVDPAKVVAQTKKFGGATLPTRVAAGSNKVVVSGDQPKSGFAVATGVAGRIHPAKDFFDRGKGVDMVDKFLVAHASHFAKPDMHLGVWHDKKTSRVFLDVTQVFPANARTIALRAGRRRNQISIFDLRTLKEIPTGGDGRIGEASHSQGSREHWGDDGRAATGSGGVALGADFSQPSAAPTRPPVRGTGQGTQAVAPDMPNEVRKVAEAIVDHVLLEYASGQPRDKKGRFGSTGSTSGGGGGAVADYKDPRYPTAQRIDIVSTDPSTAGQIQTLDVSALPAAKASSMDSVRTEQPTSTLAKHTTADGKLTPERQILHDNLIARQTLPPSEIKSRGVASEDGKPTLVIMGGGGGSGKTSVLKKLSEDDSSPEGVAMRRALDDAGIRVPQPAVKQMEDGTTTLKPTGTAAVINSDHAKHGIWGADADARGARRQTDTAGVTTMVPAAARVHEESSVIAQRALEVSIATKGDIIFDGTGDGSPAKRQGIYDGASPTHEVVGVFITTKIGKSPTDKDGIRRTVLTRNKKEIEVKTEGGTKTTKMKRVVPDEVITQGHVSSNAAIIQGIKGNPRSFDKVVVIARVKDIDPVSGKQRVYKEAGQPDQPQYKFVVAGTWDRRTDTFKETDTPEGKGILALVARRGRVDSDGKDISEEMTNAEKLAAFNEAVGDTEDEESIGTLLPPLDYTDLVAIWTEVLCGCEKKNSAVLRRNPEASQYWDDITAEVADSPEDETIDIPAEPTERSAELQSVYSTGVEGFVHGGMPTGDDEISLAEASIALPAHTNALYDAYETIAKRHGKWTQKGSDGANYVTVSPYAYEGRMCGTCAFFVSPNGCEIVEGVIRPQGGCKLNIRAAIKESETEEKD